MNEWTISPAARIKGTISVPGDKSISHRAAMLSALANGKSTITGFLESEDCLNTLKALENLGAQIERSKGRISIVGVNGKFQAPKRQPLDMGNSGTGIRLMCGLLAGQEFETTLTGDESLRSRPMRRIKEPLELMGAKISLTGERGTAPITVRGGKLSAITYKTPVASAQVKSCLLLAGLFANGTTTVIEPRHTRDHTERMLEALGIPISIDGNKVSVEGSGAPPSLKPANINVPGDFSSAAFWLAASACREGDEVCIERVGLNPRRTALLDVLRRMGADVETKIDDFSGGEPIGTVTVRGAKLKGTEIGGDEIPNLIDEIPVISAIAALAEGKTVIRNAEELRVKESDRISVMVENLRSFGIEAEEFSDGMAIYGGSPKGGTAHSKGDHRIAMSFAILALHSKSPSRIASTECVATSYPGFIADLKILTGEA